MPASPRPRPAARFADAAAFAEALRAATRGEAPAPRGWPSWATLALGACGLVVAGLLASGALEEPGPQQASRGKQEAPAPAPRPGASPLRPGGGSPAAVERLRFLEDPRRRAREAAAWLAQHPGHPRSAEVRALEVAARRTVPLHELRVLQPTRVAFLPSGERAVVCSAEGAFLWDLESGAVQRRWLTDQVLWALAVAPDGARVLVGGDRAAWLLSLDGRAEPVRHDFPGPVVAAGFGGQGNVFALGGDPPRWTCSSPRVGSCSPVSALIAARCAACSSRPTSGS